MADPQRLLDDPDASPLARTLLSSADGDAPAHASRTRAARRLGIAALVAAGTGTSGEAATIAVAWKLLGVVVAIGSAVGLATWTAPVVAPPPTAVVDKVAATDQVAAPGHIGTDTIGTDKLVTETPGANTLGTDKLGTGTAGTNKGVGTDNVVGTDTAGTNKGVGTDTAGTNKLIGTDTAGTNKGVGTDKVVGTNTAGTNKGVGTDRVGTSKRVGADKVGTDKVVGTDKLVGADTAGTNKGVGTNNLVGTDKTATNKRVGTDTAGTDKVAGTDTAGTDTPGTDTAETDTAGTDKVVGSDTSDKVEPPVAAPSAVAPPAPVDPRRLAAEVALLDRARNQLRAHQHGAALAALDDYKRQFPDGDLDAAADVVRIEVLLAMHDTSQATALGRSFLARYPRSPLAVRVRSLIGTK